MIATSRHLLATQTNVARWYTDYVTKLEISDESRSPTIFFVFVGIHSFVLLACWHPGSCFVLVVNAKVPFCTAATITMEQEYTQQAICNAISASFAEMPTERLRQRQAITAGMEASLVPQGGSSVVSPTTNNNNNNSSSSMSCSSPVAMILRPLFHHHPQLLSVVADYLDLMELQALSTCCRVARKVCSARRKLDLIFGNFRILKRQADAVHQQCHDCHHALEHQHHFENVKVSASSSSSSFWETTVLCVMLQAQKELNAAYGPYQPHPLHTAIVGELLFLALADACHGATKGRRMGRRRHDVMTSEQQIDNQVHTTLTLSDVWGCPCSSTVSYQRGRRARRCKQNFVLGSYGEYFVAKEQERQGYLPHDSESFHGSARAMVRQGSLPLVRVFARQLPEEELTEHVCLSFPTAIAERKGGDNKKNFTTYNVYYDNYKDDLLYDENIQETLEWYKSLGGGTSIATCLAQVFCQRAILYNDQQWDAWTQLLRATWLRAHGLSPFDKDDHWHRVLSAANISEQTISTARDLTHPVGVLWFECCDLHHDNNEREEEEDDPRALAMAYLQESHTLAKASDYIP